MGKQIEISEEIQNFLIGAVFFAIFGYLIFFTGGETPKEDGQSLNSKSTTTKKTEKVVGQLKQEYDARTISEEDINYTFQLQNNINSTSTPLVFTASLDDIYRNEGTYFFKLSPSSYFLDRYSYNIYNTYYTLRGCSERVNHVLNKSSSFGKYAVVAEIKELKPATLTVKGEPDGSEEAYIEIDGSQARLATGDCIDLEYIEGSSVLSTSL